MGRKKKTDLRAADIVAPPPQEWTPGDAMFTIREDMVRLQEAVTEKLAFIDGLKMVKSSPVTLSIPEESARKLQIPGVLTPTLLPLPLLVKVAKALAIDLAGVRKGAWKFLYNIEI
jgi:hypothetical protein